MPSPTEAANRHAACSAPVLLGGFNLQEGDHIASQTQHLLTAQIKPHQHSHSLIHGLWGSNSFPCQLLAALLYLKIRQ